MTVLIVLMTRCTYLCSITDVCDYFKNNKTLFVMVWCDFYFLIKIKKKRRISICVSMEPNKYDLLCVDKKAVNYSLTNIDFIMYLGI